jgi:hypothetical protein
MILNRTLDLCIYSLSFLSLDSKDLQTVSTSYYFYLNKAKLHDLGIPTDSLVMMMLSWSVK